MNGDAGSMLIVAGVAACILLFLLHCLKGLSGKVPNGEKISLAINKTDYAVLLTKPDGTLEWANPGFTRITGYELADVSGKLIGAVLLGSLHSPKASQQIK